MVAAEAKPLVLADITPIEEARFWKKVARGEPSECWEWLGATWKPFPYGKHCFRYGQYKAHRFSFVLANGGAPTDRYVCHRCDSPTCVNPAHLFLDTHAGNMHDMRDKGRANQPAGHRNGRAVLDEALVRRAVDLYNTGEYTQQDLAAALNVPLSAISNLLSGRTWRHLGLVISFQRAQDGFAAENARKTHCAHGHPFSGSNLAVVNGKRRCRECCRLRCAAYRQRRKAR